MKRPSRRWSAAIIIVIVLFGAGYQYKVANAGAYQWPPPRIDSLWVQQFMGNVSSVTGKTFHENATLDALAKQRFNTAVLVPDITHFGSWFELPDGVGEVIYYPTGHSPVGFVQGVELESPIHWSLMSSYGFSQYGYYLGQGRVALISDNCKAPELAAPNVNVTQFYASYGCPITWVVSTWLVIDMSK